MRSARYSSPFALSLAILASPLWGQSPPPPNSSAISVSNPDKVVVLPELNVNGLHERLEYRDEIRKKKGWGSFLCLENGALVDALVFLCEYKSDHPDEKIRIVMWETAANQYHYGIGNIAASRKLDAVAVYTSGSQLRARHPSWGDRVYAFFHADQISAIPDKQILREDKDLRILGGRIPSSIYGDDDNLQVYCAEQRLREIGAPVFVRPATEKTGAKNNLMLIFAVDQTYFAYRPAWGIYKLSDEGIKQLGLKPPVDGKSITTAVSP